MEPVNPYESPRETGPPESPFDDEQGGAPEGVWRDGPCLVMHKRAELPDRCVKSNRPATRRVLRALSWHHPAIYAALLGGPLIYVILALLLREKATIRVGLSDEWFARRRRRGVAAVGIVLLAILPVLVMLASQKHGSGLASVLAIVNMSVGILVAVIYGDLATGLVSPARITKEYVWLKGVHPDFLASLPPWPGKE
jgi:hypothetical protein